MNDNRFQQLREKARQAGQEHILRFWNELTNESKDKLLSQVESIDFDLLQQLKREHIDNPPERLLSGKFEPPPIIPIPKTEQQKKDAERAKRIGKKLLSEGKVGAILVAGGQGSRLGFDGPKGMFKIGPISGKTLFQIFAERIQALNTRYSTTIPWFIMTSETNHQATVDYFEVNSFFGLKAADVYFFKQGTTPAIDAYGKVFLDAKDHIFNNPNGHGGIFYALRDSGCLHEARQRGIEELFYFQIDNVLIKICDPIFIGYHSRERADMSLKIVAKRDPYEKVGVVGKIEGRLAVIEYSELSRKDKEATNDDGTLKYYGGSIAIHVFNREFIEQLCNEAKLPYHLAHKKIPYLDQTGKLAQPTEPNGYKFEMFVFDAIREAERVVIMEVNRSEEFSPIKNEKGIDSPHTARQDLVNYYRNMLEQAGVIFPSEFSPEKSLIEISARFALDGDELKSKIDPKQFQLKFPVFLDK